jgi:DNA-binding response OmpR family regulator
MKKILLVEDTVPLAEEIEGLLRLEDFEVTVAHNGAAALEMVLETRPNLILTDLLMPGMDGFDLIVRIRGLEEFKSIPIIALSARTSTVDRNRAMKAGADSFLSKPCKIQELLSAINSLMT